MRMETVLMWREHGLCSQLDLGSSPSSVQASGPQLGNLQAVALISSFMKWGEHHLLYRAVVTQ